MTSLFDQYSAAEVARQDFDIDELRERYRRERDKRVRPSGTDQYSFLEGRFEHFDVDPWAAEVVDRDPLRVATDTLIIGGGFGGLIASAALRAAGVQDFWIIDVASDFGGTWYWNRYPGARCDVESYMYLPFLEETGYMPTERYVTGQEIFAYCQQLGRYFELYQRALFQTKVTAMSWSMDDERWIVSTDRGDTLSARFVLTQSGIFSRPQLPGIPGIDTFAGSVFHTARWDYAVTGGGPNGDLHRLRDKRVGVFGTGATGLQVIPQLAQWAKHLTVFQRTPTAVHVRDNGPTDTDWFNTLPHGWQQRREELFNQLVCGQNVECGVDDAWVRFFRMQNDAVAALPDDLRGDATAIGAATERADYAWNEATRARVDAAVKDPATAEKLKAYYRTLCKRPGFADDYLPVFNQENVLLVDTSESGVDRITERSVVVDGHEHECDCLIFATGFELGTSWIHQAGYDVVGRGDIRLSDRWADGMRTFHGFFSHGFPNMFFLGLTQTGTTISVPHMLREQAGHVAFVIKHCLENGVASVEATLQAENEWQAVIAGYNELRRPFQAACTPGYFNAEGKPEDRRSAIGSGIYQPSTQFFKWLAEWRESGKFTGLTLQEGARNIQRIAS
jgi:cyclohexanone monooxygenase